MIDHQRSVVQEFYVSGMHCAACVRRVEEAILEVTGVVSAEVSLATETALVESVQGVLDLMDLYNTLDKKSDEDIIKILTEIKGVGPWTAQMFLMFTLNRPDVFPVTDLALQKGFQHYF